nr:MAG TPA: hypothetical protein [Caudoviricetes sp.]
MYAIASVLVIVFILFPRSKGGFVCPQYSTFRRI